MIARGSQVGRLYQLAPREQMAIFSTRQQRVSPSTWYSRLGHCNMNIVDSLVKQGLLYVTSVKSALPSICNSCQFAKSKQLPFAASQKGLCILLKRLSVICRVLPSPINKTHFASFVDDFSRFIWFCPMLRKSDFFDVYCALKAMVTRQFQANMKVFQTNGGGEFVSHKFQKHLQHQGIFHFVSCPHTRQQNGLVERRHRSIVETGLALLFHSSFPTSYWIDSFQIVVFL